MNKLDLVTLSNNAFHMMALLKCHRQAVVCLWVYRTDVLCSSIQCHNYRFRIEIWLWFSRLLQNKITSFSRLFKVFCYLYANKNITKLAF